MSERIHSYTRTTGEEVTIDLDVCVVVVCVDGDEQKRELLRPHLYRSSRDVASAFATAYQREDERWEREELGW